MYQLTEKDLIAIKVSSDLEQKTNLEYSRIVFDKVGFLLELMDSLYRQEVKVPGWQVWSETLIYKLCFHASSIIKLYEGSNIPFVDQGKLIKILDEPSIISLLRVVTENYLTFYYLYADKITDEERQFRLSVWRYCGIKQRVSFEVSTEQGKKKQMEEAELLETLKTEVLDSKFFKLFDRRKQEQILKGIKPRLFNSWVHLLISSGLRLSLFKNMYGYKSNYSHSEFISILQLKSSNYLYNSDAKFHFPLYLLHCIVCKAIIDLKEYFPSMQTLYASKDPKVKYEVEIIVSMAVDNTFDNLGSKQD